MVLGRYASCGNASHLGHDGFLVPEEAIVSEDHVILAAVAPTVGFGRLGVLGLEFRGTEQPESPPIQLPREALELLGAGEKQGNDVLNELLLIPNNEGGPVIIPVNALLFPFLVARL